MCSWLTFHLEALSKPCLARLTLRRNAMTWLYLRMAASLMINSKGQETCAGELWLSARGVDHHTERLLGNECSLFIPAVRFRKKWFSALDVQRRQGA